MSFRMRGGDWLLAKRAKATVETKRNRTERNILDLRDTGPGAHLVFRGAAFFGVTDRRVALTFVSTSKLTAESSLAVG